MGVSDLLGPLRDSDMPPVSTVIIDDNGLNDPDFMRLVGTDLKFFYESGGTVIVLGWEGVFDVPYNILSPFFGVVSV